MTIHNSSQSHYHIIWLVTNQHFVLFKKKSLPLWKQTFHILKGLTQLWKSRRIYPKYMPKCSVGSTAHVCKFLLKKFTLCGRYWCLKFPPRKVYVTSFAAVKWKLRIWQRTFTQFWRCKYDFVYYSNVQRTFKDGKIKSTVLTRPHAMKRHKFTSPIGTNWDL